MEEMFGMSCREYIEKVAQEEAAYGVEMRLEDPEHNKKIETVHMKQRQIKKLQNRDMHGV